MLEKKLIISGRPCGSTDDTVKQDLAILSSIAARIKLPDSESSGSDVYTKAINSLKEYRDADTDAYLVNQAVDLDSDSVDLNNFKIEARDIADGSAEFERCQQGIPGYFHYCLADFYKLARKEINIFSPDFSDEIFTDCVLDVLADKVRGGVQLTIIIKDSKYHDTLNPETKKSLLNKLKQKGVDIGNYSDSGPKYKIITNSGVPPIASQLLESCTSAFSIIDDIHYRYRDTSPGANDSGVFLFFVSGYSFYSKFLKLIKDNIFTRARRVIEKGGLRKSTKIA